MFAYSARIFGGATNCWANIAGGAGLRPPRRAAIQNTLAGCLLWSAWRLFVGDRNERAHIFAAPASGFLRCIMDAAATLYAEITACVLRRRHVINLVYPHHIRHLRSATCLSILSRLRSIQGWTLHVVVSRGGNATRGCLRALRPPALPALKDGICSPAFLRLFMARAVAPAIAGDRSGWMARVCCLCRRASAPLVLEG